SSFARPSSTARPASRSCSSRSPATLSLMSSASTTFSGICSKLTKSTCCGTPLSARSKSAGISPVTGRPFSRTSTSTRTASSFVAGGRQREEALDCGERARAIAAALGQLAERDERRLRRWKQRRRALERVARGVEAAERLVFGAEKQLAVVPQPVVGDRRQRLPQFDGRLGVMSLEAEHAPEAQMGLGHVGLLRERALEK